MANKITANGLTVGVSPKNGHKFTLEELKEIVHGEVEIVRLNRYDIMAINRDHKKNRLRKNTSATFKYHLWTGCNDTIHGDVFVGKEYEIE